MEDPEVADPAPEPQPGLRALLPTKAFLSSRKGQLLLAESVLSFLTFICYVASWAAAFMTVPLIEFLLALFLFYAYAMKVNEKFQGIHWPLLDFIRCVTAAIVYFAISIAVVSKYPDGASKAAAVLGFVATIAYALDFYLIFNDLSHFLRRGDPSDAPETQKADV
ncbi:CKLF-like MARVEL transmembrane domain-containing protein 3 isoform X2 [Rhinatrema bivittatum]|uniref:CKLF-like MARVEL transmembrane domain-containing protein 3 isoform X2 n=1 Tax=Rhinatrema bivittatum TaxID=194408 RepID=UPI0011263C47|nr:CKLF-like MARVEL transmembrane domain-containing protein 3 isoform X2 [Rhinatrema bivittatum]